MCWIFNDDSLEHPSCDSVYQLFANDDDLYAFKRCLVLLGI